MAESRISDAQLLGLWRGNPPEGWEPRGGTSAAPVQELVRRGYMRVTDGRCGFERFRDSHVVWTDAGRAACAALEAAHDAE